MWNAVGEALKVFFEKHRIPTVISIVMAIVTILVLPADYWAIEKLGKTCFLILVAGVVFLVLQILIVIAKGILRLHHKVDEARQCRERDDKKSQEAVEDWLYFADKLSPDDRELIIQFIKSGNTPIIEYGYVWHSCKSIYNTRLVIKTKRREGGTLVKLDEKAYNVFKAIYEERGSISHF